MLNMSGDTDFFTESMASLENGLGNTHIIKHAGKILALEELHFPTELTPELGTVGAYDYNGSLNTGMTAHPKVCPKTGEMLFFAYGLTPPYLTYHRVSAEGELVQTEIIEVDAATMVHDFNITENYVIFMDLPLLFDMEKIAEGGIPLKWSDDYGARLGVMPRKGTNADVVWYDIEPCYVFHPLNAYEDGHSIVIDVCRFDHYLKPGAPIPPEQLTRWTIDTESGTVEEKKLMEIPVEFPRVPDSLVGQKHRFGYMAHMSNEFPAGIGIVKYDFEANQVTERVLSKGQYCGEPVFVPRKNASSEDDGYLLLYTYDQSSDTSDFVVLDARDVESAPVACVKLGVRVPFGFHGSWIAD
jgi:carotenoid cleavage dioxygenase